MQVAGVDICVNHAVPHLGAGDPEKADPAFLTVLDGSLLLPDGRLTVGDVEQLTRFVHRLGDRGECRVRVAVDSPGADARAIDVTCHRSG
ncbi:hypothetical protein [Streptomyces sp. NPDC047024]|uniref:hypothetical protein n=1 Tax=Streptomyces sp. NPDC047024 TaxID=3155476 RepID=UPI0033ED1C91